MAVLGAEVENDDFVVVHGVGLVVDEEKIKYKYPVVYRSIVFAGIRAFCGNRSIRGVWFLVGRAECVVVGCGEGQGTKRTGAQSV